MRTCQSCGKENPPDQDFCSCGEYLRWEPTGFMSAITPEAAAQAAAEAPPPAQPATPPQPPPAPPEAKVTPAAPVQPEPGNGHGNGHQTPATPPPPPPVSTSPVPAAPPPPAPAPIPKIAKTLVHGAVPAPQSPAAPAEPESATIVLRLPEGDPAKGETLHQAVEPGQRARVLALVRNQSGIVDNYDLRVEGMPDDWWSIYPSTVYLVPFGSGGTYEQEVEIHLHPPRGPEAEAKMWELRVVADSKAQTREAAAAPLGLHVMPYVETTTSLRPQRKKGRRKADFDVTVVNKANAPVLIALEGEDPDGELQFGFNRPPQEIPPGAAVTSRMRVRPPKQIWIGRPQDRRLEVKTVTGEEAAARAAAEPLGADVLAQQGPPVKQGFFRRRSMPHIPGVYGPRVYKPQVYPPDVNLGPGGINLRMPQLKAPQVQAPQMGSLNASQLAKPGQIKLPGRGGAPATPAAPLLPTQGFFRQKPWLPWWAVPLIIVLLALLLLLYKLLPQNVTVPKVVGERSAFTAEEKLTKSELKLDPNQKQQLDAKAKPGTVIGQTPAPGVKAKKGEAVSILVAVGSVKVNVPKIVGLTASDADKALRGKELTLGQSSPTDADPAAKISSQIPAADEVVKKGTPVNIFYPDPTAADKKKGDKKDAKGKAGAGVAAGGAGAGAGGGGGGAKDIVVPAIAGAKVDVYAKKAADLGIVPEVSKQFDDSPPTTLFRTVPEPGTKVAAGAKVKLLVSVGQPQVVFTSGKGDILRRNGATGNPLPAVASGPQDDANATWSADGTHVAYTADGRIMLKDVTKKNATAVPLTEAGGKFADLAWAPTADVNVLAFDEASEKDSDLCLAQVKAKIEPDCIAEPDFSVSRAIHWAPDGKSILGFAVKNDLSGFGMVRWKTKKGKPAFSTDTADWGKGHFVSDMSKKGKAVLDAALSPDGKRLALISNQGTSAYRLWLGEPGDFLLTSAKITPTRACKLAWRGDSKELMVIQSDAGCGESVGTLVRVAVGQTRSEKVLSPSANDPSYQPFVIEKK